ncbi:coniferyl aldehyde dehydrogenase [Zooshikella ganghwensis]|uniref:Aldehyde dehydrogenase n=1 Tax=Zooshikella ganghwensis TaxID=202772 RepID=A0A4P9VGH0_9GAMM|nr:coniferyl aldehyde dehydrogenase [Zooshikella ganghwensis]RDH42163.1 coniferyl aldehyde dehydrogenase [Zooshikella ganghwensis]
MTSQASLSVTAETQENTLTEVFSLQKSAFQITPYPSLTERKHTLQLLHRLLVNHQQNIIDAINNDFGLRSSDESRIAEIIPSLQAIHYTLKRLPRWMKPKRRHVSWQLQPASCKILYQPLGVAGIMVPWNYPLFLAVSPLVAALSAGNRAMVKMSEYTPHTAELFKQLITDNFPEDLISVITGNADIAIQFSQLPFDHLLFTGSTQTGKKVMQAAANNLTPVTLELGGKSPTIIAPDYPINEAAKRICFGKSLNAGQTCVAPDYILLPENQLNLFIDAFTAHFQQMYPDFAHNSSYSHIINDRQFQRLQQGLVDAQQKGAKIINVSDFAPDATTRRFPIHLVTHTNESMLICQEEIFGPILPLITYSTIEQAISFVNQQPRPLALYLFSHEQDLHDKVLVNTHSGGVCLNETLLHVAVDDLPFGGVGPSGMGHYHGQEGFQTFSQAKSILKKGRINSTQFIYPPYKNKAINWLYKLLLR